MSQVLVNNVVNPWATVLLAHGAGAGMDTDFMNAISDGLSQHQIQVVRFEFPYMAKRRHTGKKSPPNRLPILQQTFQEHIYQLPAPLFLAGKSMGGRVATTIVQSSTAMGAIAYGYPFHPPGRPEKLRIEHLTEISKRLLIVQGSRDPFGKRIENPLQWLPHHAQLTWLEDGDHSFKPRKSSGRTLEQNISEAVEATVIFMDATLKLGT